MKALLGPAVPRVFGQKQYLIEEHLLGLGLVHAMFIYVLPVIALVPVETDDF